MIAGMYEQEFAAYLLLGILLNFLFSLFFGLYLSRNIGMEEMLRTRGERQESWAMMLLLFIPYAKMALTLYRVAVLQFFFLDRGYSHKEYWIYLSSD